MTRFAILPAIFLLSACSSLEIPDLRGMMGSGGGATDPEPMAIEPAVQMTARERLISATEANGCVIDATTIGPIMTQAAIDADDLKNVVPALELEGIMTPDGEDKVRLNSDNCTA